MLKDEQRVSTAKMTIHIHFYNIFEEKQVIFEGGKYFFFRVRFRGEYALGFR